MRPKVFVVQAIPQAPLEVMQEVADVEVFPSLRRQISLEETIEAARRSDYLVALHGNYMPAEVITANPNLRGIAILGGTTVHVDFDAALAHKVPIVTSLQTDMHLWPGGGVSVGIPSSDRRTLASVAANCSGSTDLAMTKNARPRSSTQCESTVSPMVCDSTGRGVIASLGIGMTRRSRNGDPGPGSAAGSLVHAASYWPTTVEIAVSVVVSSIGYKRTVGAPAGNGSGR